MNRADHGQRIAVLVAAALAIGWLPARAVAEPPTARERAQVRSAQTAIAKAANLYRAKKFTAAGEALEEVQQTLDKLAENDSPELIALTADVHKRMARARELLKAEGIEVRAAMSLGAGKKAVSFTRQIAPILVARCESCHMRRSRGELSMATFAALAKGSPAGAVIMAGDAKRSRAVELIENGDMPREGEKVTPEELALLVAWINAGAKFDGPDPTALLTNFRAPGANPAAAMPAVVTAADDDEVLFSRDLGKVLVENCLECHGEDNPRNQFSVATFNRLLQGGDSGQVIVQGKPDESLLIKKLRGMAGERMPLDRPPLGEAAIAQFEKWLALGGKFDGADANASLEDTVALTAALAATHDELQKSRAELAARNWRLILPDAKSEVRETPNVLVYGSVDASVLAKVAATADEQVAKLVRLFKLPVGPIIKGRLTLYVFEKRYDYGEVGRMLEEREIPAWWRGHWRYTAVDAYGCLLVENDEVSPGLVAQQIAGAYVASLGKVPRWFAEGTARSVADHLDGKDPRVKQWDEQVTRILKNVEQPEAFLTDGLPPDDGDLLGYSFVKYLMGMGGRHATLLGAMREGSTFEAAFNKAFGGTPTELAEQWKARAGRRR